MDDHTYARLALKDQSDNREYEDIQSRPQSAAVCRAQSSVKNTKYAGNAEYVEFTETVPRRDNRHVDINNSN